MFTRIISRSTHRLVTLLDEPERAQEKPHGIGDTVLLVAAGFGLAAIVVTLTTLTALGLDALLHASFSLHLDM